MRATAPPRATATTPSSKRMSTPPPARTRDAGIQLATGWAPTAATKTDTSSPNPDGGSPIHPDLINQIFERLLAKLDLPRIRLYGLRHTHPTILLLQGVDPKVVSGSLRHVSVSFTMNVYQHVLPGSQAQATATFDDG